MTILRPWPDVPECYGFHPGDQVACPQCDGSHDHAWVQGEDPGRKTIPVRCRHCGARKCDRPACVSRRHHADHHVFASGDLEPIGGWPER